MSNVIKTSYHSKNGFFIIDENSPSVIDILPNVFVKILVINTKKPLTLNLESGSKVEFFGFFYETCPAKIFFHQNEPDSHLSIHALFYNDTLPLTSQLKSYIHADNCSSKVDITGLVQSQKLSLDSVIEIEKGIEWIEAHLDIENVFLSEEGSVSSIPTLLVRSDDVIASHSSKTHRIEREKLFYLMSRGLNYEESLAMMIEGYFHKNFASLKEHHKDIFSELLQKFFSLRD